MHWRRKWQRTPVFLPGENPRDGGAWWAAVYGVAQSQTRLKRLSSSSSSKQRSSSVDSQVLSTLFFFCHLPQSSCLWYLVSRVPGKRMLWLSGGWYTSPQFSPDHITLCSLWVSHSFCKTESQWLKMTHSLSLLSLSTWWKCSSKS